MTLRHVLLLIALACVHRAADARVVLISDIDDTVRVTHVRSKLKAALRTLYRNEAFSGMADLYRQIKTLPEGASVFYISAKPQGLDNRVLTVTHREMLSAQGFPDRENLFLRDSGNPLDNDPRRKRAHKHAAIREIVTNALAELRSDEALRIVMVGDNGEDDAQVYDESARALAAKLPPRSRARVRFHQYIRNVYGASGQAPRAGQRLFAVADELALLLARDGVLAPSGAAAVRDLVAGMPADFSNVAEAPPKWVDCRNHSLEPLLPLASDETLARATTDTIRRLETLCRLGEHR